MNVIDALVVGPRILSPSELAYSPQLGYELSSIYSGIREGAEKDSILRLRRARAEWLEEWGEELIERDYRLGTWQLKVLDTTNYNRPKIKTVEVGYAHGVAGMRPGHTISILGEPVLDGSWFLPLATEVLEVGESATGFGAQQVVNYVSRYGWSPEEILDVDAAYTNAPFLQPVHKAGANILGRVSSRRVFFLPPPPYSGFGRPKVRGRKIKLSDGRTLPPIDFQEQVTLENGRSFEISQWSDVRMKRWAPQPLVLYRVIEYKANGEPRYSRPLWLIFVAATPEIKMPTPGEAQAAYENRFSVEHSIRLQKRDIGLVSGQFSGPGAIDRIQLWVELVATSVWVLFALRALASSIDLNWPKWWRSRKLTPGAVRRLALALFVILGIPVPLPQKRGKSPGRSLGTKFEPRPRFRIFRKRKKRSTA